MTNIEWGRPIAPKKRGELKPAIRLPDQPSEPVFYPEAEHFGEHLQGTKFGHKMTRGLYAYPNRKPHQRWKREQLGEQRWASSAWAYRDEEQSQHSDAYLLVQRDAALVNYDLSMQYFETLDLTEFEHALTRTLAKGRTFKPVQSLRDLEGVSGSYVMVFDEYRQFYVGKADNLRRRIRQHWVGRKGFDRLIMPNKYESIFPMDELRALDTTRIYVARSSNPYAVEKRAENAADPQYCLNRMVGGAANPLTLMLTAADPRRRPHAVASVHASLQEWRHAADEVRAIINNARASSRSALVAELANMDMTIHSIKRENGSQFMWSRRDAIGSAAARGDLSVNEFASFLKDMGETILWPED